MDWSNNGKRIPCVSWYLMEHVILDFEVGGQTNLKWNSSWTLQLGTLKMWLFTASCLFRQTPPPPPFFSVVSVCYLVQSGRSLLPLLLTCFPWLILVFIQLNFLCFFLSACLIVYWIQLLLKLALFSDLPAPCLAFGPSWTELNKGYKTIIIFLFHGRREGQYCNLLASAARAETSNTKMCLSVALEI